jgi:hypothetical protein
MVCAIASSYLFVTRPTWNEASDPCTVVTPVHCPCSEGMTNPTFWKLPGGVFRQAWFPDLNRVVGNCVRTLIVPDRPFPVRFFGIQQFTDRSTHHRYHLFLDFFLKQVKLTYDHLHLLRFIVPACQVCCVLDASGLELIEQPALGPHHICGRILTFYNESNFIRRLEPLTSGTSEDPMRPLGLSNFVAISPLELVISTSATCNIPSAVTAVNPLRSLGVFALWASH